MPYLNLPDFEPRQVLTAAQLNQIISALQGFSAQPADISWPLICGGNIDFDKRYTIVGLRTFWNIVNANEYETLQDAVDAAESKPGGTCVFIPPSTTISADSVEIEADNIWIIGCGDSSVIQSTGSSGYSLRTNGGARTNIGLANLRMDGNSVAGQDGIQFKHVDGVTVLNVTFEDWDGSALFIGNDGTPGTEKCENVTVSGCRFSGGGGAHIEVDDIDVGSFTNIQSTTATATAALDFEPSAAGAFIKNLRIDGITIDATTGIGMQVLGGAAASNDNWSLIDITNVQVTGASSTAMIVGTTSKRLKHTTIRNCSAPASASGSNALIANIEKGKIDGNYFRDSTPDAAIDLNSCSSISMQGNDVVNSTTIAIDKSSAVDVYHNNNPGDFGPGFSSSDSTGYSRTGSTGDIGYLFTLGGGSVRAGDVLRITVFGGVVYDGANNGEFRLELAGAAITSSGLINKNTDLWMQWDVHVIATSGASNTKTWATVLYDITGAADELDNVSATDTVDFTSDVDVTFNVINNGGDTEVSVDYVTIELLGSA
jgi:hypothetical protein